MFLVRKSGSQLLSGAIGVFRKAQEEIHEALDTLNEEIILNDDAQKRLELERLDLVAAEKQGMEVLVQINKILGYE